MSSIERKVLYIAETFIENSLKSFQVDYETTLLGRSAESAFIKELVLTSIFSDPSCPGFFLYILGQTGTGKTLVVKRILKSVTDDLPALKKILKAKTSSDLDQTTVASHSYALSPQSPLTVTMKLNKLQNLTKRNAYSLTIEDSLEFSDNLKNLDTKETQEGNNIIKNDSNINIFNNTININKTDIPFSPNPKSSKAKLQNSPLTYMSPQILHEGVSKGPRVLLDGKRNLYDEKDNLRSVPSFRRTEIINAYKEIDDSGHIYNKSGYSKPLKHRRIASTTEQDELKKRIKTIETAETVCVTEHRWLVSSDSENDENIVMAGSDFDYIALNKDNYRGKKSNHGKLYEDSSKLRFAADSLTTPKNNKMLDNSYPQSPTKLTSEIDLDFLDFTTEATPSAYQSKDECFTDIIETAEGSFYPMSPETKGFDILPSPWLVTPFSPLFSTNSALPIAHIIVHVNGACTSGTFDLSKVILRETRKALNKLNIPNDLVMKAFTKDLSEEANLGNIHSTYKNESKYGIFFSKWVRLLFLVRKEIVDRRVCITVVIDELDAIHDDSPNEFLIWLSEWVRLGLVSIIGIANPHHSNTSLVSHINVKESYERQMIFDPYDSFTFHKIIRERLEAAAEISGIKNKTDFLTLFFSESVLKVLGSIIERRFSGDCRKVIELCAILLKEKQEEIKEVKKQWLNNTLEDNLKESKLKSDIVPFLVTEPVSNSFKIRINKLLIISIIDVNSAVEKLSKGSYNKENVNNIQCSELSAFGGSEGLTQDQQIVLCYIAHISQSSTLISVDTIEYGVHNIGKSINIPDIIKKDHLLDILKIFNSLKLIEIVDYISIDTSGARRGKSTKKLLASLRSQSSTKAKQISKIRLLANTTHIIQELMLNDFTKLVLQKSALVIPKLETEY